MEEDKRTFVTDDESRISKFLAMDSKIDKIIPRQHLSKNNKASYLDLGEPKVEDCIEDLDYLINTGFCINLGSWPDQNHYIAVFGYKYAEIQVKSIREDIKKRFQNAITLISKKSYFSMIYVHTGVNTTNKGALSAFK